MAFALSVGTLALAALGGSAKIYHLNPIEAGVVPVNMDTGDALGDLYFYLGQFLLPLECANKSNHSSGSFDCNNPERVGDLVVTEVDVEFREDVNYTVYSGCNLCNGTDPFTGDPCVKGTYVCDCFKDGSCKANKVGFLNVSTFFAPKPIGPKCLDAFQTLCPFAPQPGPGPQREDPKCDKCLDTHHDLFEKEYGCGYNDFGKYCPNPTNCAPENVDWPCWRYNIPRKTGGAWYSTLKEGQCGVPGALDNCTWTVKTTKTVNETCMHQSIVDTITDYSPACFQECPQPKNESSSCFIGCFFEALLGPNAGNDTASPLGGIPADLLESGWTRAFNGRCPLIPPAP